MRRKCTSDTLTLSLFEGQYCPGCSQWKPLEDFSVIKKQNAHAKGMCYPCAKTYRAAKMRMQRLAKPEQYRATNRAYYWNNVEKKRRQARNWYASHIEIVSERSRQSRNSRIEFMRAKYKENYKRRAQQCRHYQQMNRQSRTAQQWTEAREKSRQYRRDHPLLASEYKVRRRARKLNAAVIEKVDRPALIARDNRTCYLCLRIIPLDEFATLDHVIPLSKGGTHTADNLKTACHICNCRKNARTLEEYYRCYPQ